MWTDTFPSRAIGLATFCLTFGAIEACRSSEPDFTCTRRQSVRFHVEVMTAARQRVCLEVDDGRPETPLLTATADLPAHSTSQDFAAKLAFVLGQQECAASAEDGCLVFPPGLTPAKVTIEKRSGDTWIASGADDLSCQHSAVVSCSMP